MATPQEKQLETIATELRRLRDDLLTAILPTISSRAGLAAVPRALPIFECEDYKCDTSFKCTDYKCSGGGFKCNDVFRIQAQPVSFGGSEPIVANKDVQDQ